MAFDLVCYGEDLVPSGAGVIVAVPLVSLDRWVFLGERASAARVIVVDHTSLRVAAKAAPASGLVEVVVVADVQEALALARRPLVIGENEAWLDGQGLAYGRLGEGFAHPAECSYVFGGDYCGLHGLDPATVEAEWLTVPGYTNGYADTMAAVILWDRMRG